MERINKGSADHRFCGPRLFSNIHAFESVFLALLNRRLAF